MFFFSFFFLLLFLLLFLTVLTYYALGTPLPFRVTVTVVPGTSSPNDETDNARLPVAGQWENYALLNS